MPRNGSGVMAVYTPGTPYSSNTTIASATANSVNSDVAAEITNSIAADGQTQPTQNLPMNSKKHTTVANATARDQYAAYGQVQDSAALWGGTSGGTANAQTLTLTPAITAYAAGQAFEFIVGTTNTAATTVAVSGLATKNIFYRGVALIGGELVAGSVVTVIYDGTQFELRNPRLPLIVRSATTSGTSVSFTAIPAWARKIVYSFEGVSTSGSSDLLIQLGTSGGFVVTGYNGAWSKVEGTTTAGAHSTGFLVSVITNSSSTVYGSVTLALSDAANGVWSESGNVADSSQSNVTVNGGTISLAGVLTQLKLIAVNGTDTFDAGAVSVQYW